MSYLAAYTDVQNIGNLGKISQEKIDVHFPLAKSKIIEMITEDTYDLLLDAGSETPAEDNDYTEGDFALAKTGEAYMVLSLLIPAINTLSDGAGIKKVTGWDLSRNELLDMGDVDALCDRYKAEAEKIFAKYRQERDADEDTFEDRCVAGNIKMVSI